MTDSRIQELAARSGVPRSDVATMAGELGGYRKNFLPSETARKSPAHRAVWHRLTRRAGRPDERGLGRQMRSSPGFRAP